MTATSMTTEREDGAGGSRHKLMYVCSCCADNSPENCGHFNRNELREWPEEGGGTTWLCEDCYDAHTSEDLGGGAKPAWSSLPIPPAAMLHSPAPTGDGEAEKLAADIAEATGCDNPRYNVGFTAKINRTIGFWRGVVAALRRAQPPQPTGDVGEMVAWLRKLAKGRRSAFGEEGMEGCHHEKIADLLVSLDSRLAAQVIPNWLKEQPEMDYDDSGSGTMTLRWVSKDKRDCFSMTLIDGKIFGHDVSLDHSAKTMWTCDLPKGFLKLDCAALSTGAGEEK